MTENSNKFLELINSQILNTDNTVRYSLIYQTKIETLSDHITDVMLLSYLIALRLNSYGEQINVGLLLEKVLLHDLDEVLTGDIPRTTKYYSEAGLQAMREVADDAIKVIADSFLGAEGIVDTWRESKSGKEGIILHLTDMICVAKKTVKEIKMLGNGYFLKVAYEMRSNLDNLIEEIDNKSYEFKLFNEKSLDYLRDVVSDAHVIMSELCNDSRLTKYGVIDSVFRK